MAKIIAGLIVKNEEKHLPDCLRSIESAVDAVVIVDTGSTDNTQRVAMNCINKPIYFYQYLDASEQDEKGDWKLWDFSKARNEFIKYCELLGADYILWMDADDVLKTPHVVRQAVDNHPHINCFGFNIHNGAGPTWIHHRLWKAKLGVHFEGKIHEYITIPEPVANLEDSLICHNAEPTPHSEDSNARNLRILMRAVEEEPNNSRTLFYLANTYKDHGDFHNAIKWYKRRIEVGPAYRDEWLFAYLYMANCQAAVGLLDDAERTCFEALNHDREWSEFWMTIARIEYQRKRYDRVIAYCRLARLQKPKQTNLWREYNQYADQPARMTSWAWEHMGCFDEALEWAIEAKTLIIGPDKDWDDRILRLQAVINEKNNNNRATAAVC